jgi:hypothetical protein
MIELASPLSALGREEQNWRKLQSDTCMARKPFAELLLEAVDESLLKLEATSPQVIYALLERCFYLNRAEIPVKVERFEEALKAMFGYAAKIIEIRIITCLNRKIGPIPNYPSEVSDLFLSEYVKAARSTVPE